MHLSPNIFKWSAPVLMSLFVAACVAPEPPRPTVSYPVTYMVQIGNTQVRSTDGPQNLNVAATQDITVDPGRTFYYQIVSPVIVNVEIYELVSGTVVTSGTTHTTTTTSTVSTGRALVSQVQGDAITASVKPNTSSLRFVFTAAQPNSTGTLKFTFSDRPIPAAVSTVR